MSTVLLVDAGQSSTRLVLEDDGGSRRLTLPGVHHLAGQGAAELVEWVRSACAALGAPLLDAIGIGSTGWDRTAARTISRTISNHCGGSVVRLADDSVTAHFGAFDGRDGIAVVLGTGIVAVGAVERTVVRVGGWGAAIDDAGSAYWIGQSGLRTAVRLWETGRVDEPLVVAAIERYGPLAALSSSIHDGDEVAATVAAFSVDVARLAESDPAAGRLWHAAVGEIAQLVRRTVEALGDRPGVDVATVGGLTSAGDQLTIPLASALAKFGLVLVAPHGSPIDGARRLVSRAVEPGWTDFVSTSEDP